LAYKNITNYDKINIYNPSVVISKNALYASTIEPFMDRNTNAVSDIKRAGIYFQDLISIIEKVKLLGGIRYNYLENTSPIH
jgi:iron complex outermembrane receptor protein